jgi:hypothetical protein
MCNADKLQHGRVQALHSNENERKEEKTFTTQALLRGDLVVYILFFGITNLYVY